jgi:hypothetical protein
MAAPWPLPALAAWTAAWLAYLALRWLDAPPIAALSLAAILGAMLSIGASTPWRRVFVGAGFPLSLAASGVAGGLPPWAWLAPLGALVFLYPVHAWRDAPVFPTRRGALEGLAACLPLRHGAEVLDAGCGLGDALLELHRQFPAARLSGVEWSRPLRLLSAWRCRFARVRRADMWSVDWSAFDLVYLFQRPESMQRAADKAGREMRPGTWLASLEFEIPSRQPSQVFACADGRRLWLYASGSGARK